MHSNEVVVTGGATAALEAMAMAICDDGDALIVPAHCTAHSGIGESGSGGGSLGGSVMSASHICPTLATFINTSHSY